jgi:hypothetical protein
MAPQAFEETAKEQKENQWALEEQQLEDAQSTNASIGHRCAWLTACPVAAAGEECSELLVGLEHPHNADGLDPCVQREDDPRD